MLEDVQAKSTGIRKQTKNWRKLQAGTNTPLYGSGAKTPKLRRARRRRNGTHASLRLVQLLDSQNKKERMMEGREEKGREVRTGKVLFFSPSSFFFLSIKSEHSSLALHTYYMRHIRCCTVHKCFAKTIALHKL